MAKLNYTKIRKTLEDERLDLIKQVENLDQPQEHMNPDRDDLAQDFITREKTEALKALELEQIDQIGNALKRLDEGTYGLCIDCGEEIQPERLEIIPYATLCVNCQSKNEKRW